GFNAEDCKFVQGVYMLPAKFQRLRKCGNGFGIALQPSLSPTLHEPSVPALRILCKEGLNSVQGLVFFRKLDVVVSLLKELIGEIAGFDCFKNSLELRRLVRFGFQAKVFLEAFSGLCVILNSEIEITCVKPGFGKSCVGGR